MGRIINRHRERVAGPPPKDWKDSRLVIAALAAAGTATFMGTVVVPLTTTALTSKLEALAPAEEKINKLEKELAENKAALAIAKVTAAEATAKTPFLPGSAYPVGLDLIRIGASIQQLKELYPKGEWGPEDLYYSVKNDHSVFWAATYYFKGEGDGRRVSSILFHLNHDSPLKGGAIKTRFHVLFGDPVATGKLGRSLWKVSQRESVEVVDGSTYTVRPGNYAPFWASPLEKEKK